MIIAKLAQRYIGRQLLNVKTLDGEWKTASIYHFVHAEQGYYWGELEVNHKMHKIHVSADLIADCDTVEHKQLLIYKETAALLNELGFQAEWTKTVNGGYYFPLEAIEPEWEPPFSYLAKCHDEKRRQRGENLKLPLPQHPRLDPITLQGPIPHPIVFQIGSSPPERLRAPVEAPAPAASPARAKRRGARPQPA